MRQTITVALFECRWQLRRKGAVLFWLSMMLFPLIQPAVREQAALTLIGSQSRLFMLAAPVMMMGALSRDHMDGVEPLLRSTGLFNILYPTGKWLGLIGVQGALLGSAWALSSLQVGLSGDHDAWSAYQTLFFATMPATVVLYTAVGLVAEGCFGNPWRMYPAALLIGLGATQLDSPLTLAYRDLTMSQFYTTLQREGWHLVWVRWGLYALLSVLVVGIYTAWRVMAGQRRTLW
jgi:hypothetical protein